MSSAALTEKKQYTFADYLSWMDDSRYELFNGKVKKNDTGTFSITSKNFYITFKVLGKLFQISIMRGISCPI